jgi:uncharacterized protein (DUF934 family)
MPEPVIRAGRIARDPWRFLGLEAPVDPAAAFPAGPLAVPLAAWKARRGELLGRDGPAGVWLDPADDPDPLVPDLPDLALVGIRFPKFSEGRGYSTAALLRRRHGYRGELRAFGDLGRDHLFYLARVGFDAFSLRPGTDLEAALAGLRDFTVRYQGAADDPRPLFRRRLEGALA